MRHLGVHVDTNFAAVVPFILICKVFSIPKPQRGSLAQIKWLTVVCKYQLLVKCVRGGEIIPQCCFEEWTAVLQIFWLWVDYVIGVVGNNDVEWKSVEKYSWFYSSYRKTDSDVNSIVTNAFMIAYIVFVSCHVHFKNVFLGINRKKNLYEIISMFLC